jgi:hypothetical protein
MLKRFILIIISLILILCSCVSTSGSKVKKGSMPAWVNDVYSGFDRTKFVAASGFGKDRAQAEANALAALTSFFGQTVEVEKQAASSYSQAVVNGVMDSWIDTAQMRTSVKSVSTFDNLPGAEIKEVWFDSKDTYYAAAVMDKARSIRIYNDLVQANQNIINNLVSMSSAEKNTMEGVIRFKFAAAVADINVSYRNILRLLDSNPPSGVTGDQYRLEAQNIIKRIPVSIRITNDRNGRIFSALAKQFSALGFETVNVPAASAAKSRYVMEVNSVLSPVNLPDNPNVFSRIELTANFKDTDNNQVLLPYSFISREGHTSQAEADNRCILAAERNINDTFAVLLSDYLMQLRPKR